MMRKRILTLLVVFIGVSCIGIMSLQFHWVKQSVEKEDTNFNLSVSQSMSRVVSELEQVELIKYFNSLRQQPSIINSLNLLNQQLSNLLEANSKQYKEKGSNSGYLSSANDDISSYAWLSLLSLEDSLALEKFLSFHTKQSDLQETEELISKFIGNTLDDILYYPFEINIYIPLLDSLIAYSLERNGIQTEYSFGIYNTFSELYTYASRPENIVDIEKSVYRYALFPNSMGETENFLIISFPYKTSFIFSRVSYFIWSSIIFIAVIIFSFVFALSIIFRQRRLSEEKNDFINNMTHEIKTPIATISLATEALRDETIEQNKELQKTYINIIKEENKRLEMLVIQILEQAKRENVNQSLKKEDVDIHEIIKEGIGNMDFIVQQKGGKIKVRLSSKNPIVSGDKDHLLNVLSNLIDNANKYSPKTPNILISTTDSTTGIEVRVKDNGVGISRKDHKKIFEKFYRVPTGNVHNVKGYGVGLSYVKHIILMHGGNIRVESEPKKGSTFIIFLPYKRG